MRSAKGYDHKRNLSSKSPSNDTDSHNALVKDISRTIRGFYDRKERYRINHGSTNSTRQPSSKGTNFVDLSKLNRVLKVDREAMTALVEPNVPMDRLVEATLEHGLIPKIVMDFPGITVGGGYAGTSGESSSFKHGFFDRTLNFVEIVLGNGEVVRCSDTENADLFVGAAGAVGTLGTTTCAEVQLEQAKDFVEVTFHPVSSMAQAIAKTKASIEDSTNDYIDGIMYSLSQGVVVTGSLVDSKTQERPIRRFSAPSDPWFYLHARSVVSSSSKPVKELVPLADYLFRYDRGGFWVGRLAFEYFYFPFNRWTRWFLDDFLHTRMMYSALHASGQTRRIVVQDLALPYDTAEGFVRYCDDKLAIYPLWLCPLKTTPRPTFHPHLRSAKSTSNSQEKDQEHEMLNIGLWGQPRRSPLSKIDFVALNRDLEAKLTSLGGTKWLYAQTYYPSAQAFYDNYGGRQWYDDLRKKYHAEDLPHVYEKVAVDIARDEQRAKQEWWKGLWPLGGIAGLAAAIRSGSWKQARRPKWMSYGDALR